VPLVSQVDKQTKRNQLTHVYLENPVKVTVIVVLVVMMVVVITFIQWIDCMLQQPWGICDLAVLIIVQIGTTIFNVAYFAVDIITK